MNLFRSLAITSYHGCTLPYRRWKLHGRISRSEVPIAILFYHRVADHDPTPWTIDCRQFTRQIRWLKRRFDLISLGEAQQRIRNGNRRPAVCITFDDGYEDNADFALPLLASLQIPTMYFVTQGYLDSDSPFEHDADLGLHLQPNRTATLRRWVGSSIEFGGHTRTHRDLGTLQDLDLLYDEIVVAGHDLQEQLGATVEHFAFPFGQPSHTSTIAFELARQAGLKSVSTAYGGWNWVGQSDFHLQRIHADPHLCRLKNWLTGDPRTERVGTIPAAESGSEFERVGDYLDRRSRRNRPESSAPGTPTSDTPAIWTANDAIPAFPTWPAASPPVITPSARS